MDALVDALIQTVGEEDAPAALLYALERGYSLEQVEAAAFAGTLNADGVITGVTPAGPLLGLIVLPGGVTVAGLGAPPPAQPEAVLNPLGVGADSVGTGLLRAIVLLIFQSGYTLDQVIEGILLGDALDFSVFLPDDAPSVLCLGLRDTNGNRIAPAGAPLAALGSSACRDHLREQAPGADPEEKDKEVGDDDTGGGTGDPPVSITTCLAKGIPTQIDENGNEVCILPDQGGDDDTDDTGGSSEADDIAACLKQGGTPAPYTDGAFDGLATCELPGAFD